MRRDERVTDEMVLAHAKEDAIFAGTEFSALGRADRTRYLERSHRCLSAALSIEQTEPVAWYVKDYADGWIHFDNEVDAIRERDATGAMMHVAFPAYAHPPVSALVNAQADADVVERWQPIDTAPRDGRVVLAYFPLEGLGADWCRVMPVYFSKTMQPHPWIFAGRAASSYGEGPTHWQPLPAPPTTGIADSAEAGGSATAASVTSAIRQRGESE